MEYIYIYTQGKGERVDWMRDWCGGGCVRRNIVSTFLILTENNALHIVGIYIEG